MTTFPILSLPEKSLKTAIRCLTVEEIIKFSLISKSTKLAAKSLDLQADATRIYIHECVYVVVHAKFNRRFYQQDIPWNPVEVDLRTFLDHSQSVLHTDKFELLFVCSDNYDWKSIYEALDGLEIPNTSLQYDSQNVWLHKLVNQFSRLSLAILVSNFKWYRPMLSSYRQNLTVVAGFTDLLSVNCVHLEVRPPISSKEINLFLKHWIKGAFQPLESVVFPVGADYDNLDEVFKGVKLEVTSVADLETLPLHHSDIKFAVDIYRFDETRATAVIEGFRLSMYVWK